MIFIEYFTVHFKIPHFDNFQNICATELMGLSDWLLCTVVPSYLLLLDFYFILWLEYKYVEVVLLLRASFGSYPPVCVARGKEDFFVLFSLNKSFFFLGKFFYKDQNCGEYS